MVHDAHNFFAILWADRSNCVFEMLGSDSSAKAALNEPSLSAASKLASGIHGTTRYPNSARSS